MKKGGSDTKNLAYLSLPEKQGVNSFTERRRRKRCPQCQALAVFVVILLSSIGLSFLFNVFPSLVDKGDFQVISADSFGDKKSIAIDADLKMNFTDDVVDALENGIPLTIAVEVQVLRERLWWRNIIIKESRQLFELRYHPLTNVHEVKNIATNERYTFNSRQDAMAVLGTIRGAHLIEKKELSRDKQYYIQMRILLDVSHLPPALRQIASLSPSWRLESTWFRWLIDDKPRSQAKIAEVEQNNLTLELKRKSKVKEPIQILDDSTDNMTDNNSDNQSADKTSDSSDNDSINKTKEPSE
ncbi:MAG: DUF4390 domain-containing protein [Gammaproteobacteria bacterium]|nr:DUF4390 domain-containing protein [Gammaproteobacteria bacterium]